MATISGIGRLGQEPKMQYTPSGTALTHLNVAVNMGFGDKRETLWVSLSSFGAMAELLNEKLSKGNRIVFTAELTGVHTYEKRDNSTGVQWNAKIVSFEFVDFAKSADGGEEPEEF